MGAYLGNNVSFHPRTLSQNMHLRMHPQSCGPRIRMPRTWELYSSTDSRVKDGIRLGLISPSPLNIALCMVAFKVYHALKQNYRLEVNRAIALEDFEEIWDIVHEPILHLTKEFNLRSSVVMGSQNVLPACVTQTADIVHLIRIS